MTRVTAVAVVLLFGLTFGCVPMPPKPQQTQLQIREFQTRTYETKDTKMVMKAVLNVQDDGFIVKNANVELGLITATKEVDVEDKGAALFAALLGGHEARWNKNSAIECSGNVSDFGATTRVRVNFQMKVMNNKGEVVDVKQMDNAAFYQDFFSKVDKGIFIEKEKL
jgi:hypothetical protein